MKHTFETIFSKSFLLRCLLIALAVFLAVHAFCYFNLTLRGESLMLNAEKTNSTAISQGQFLRPFYWRLRGAIASPLLIGLISFASLFVAEVALAVLFGLTDLIPFTVLSFILFSGPALLELNVTTLYTSDAVCLALCCMAVASLLLLKSELFPIPTLVRLPVSFLLLLCSLGLMPGLSCCFLCIVLIHLLSVSLNRDDEHETSRLSLRPAAISLLTGCAAFLVFFLAAFFMCRRSGNDFDLGLIPADGKSFVSSLILPLTSLFIPVTIYPHLLPVIRICLILFALISLLRQKSLPAVLFLILLIPAMTLPMIGSGAPQFPFSFLFLDIALLVLIVHMDWAAIPASKILRFLLRGAYTLLFLGSLVFANHAYLKINLDFDTSLSLVTQIITRLEERTDFEPAAVQVAFIGSPADSPLVQEREGFEHLSAMRALKGSTSLTEKNQLTWYFWETLGYPMNCLSDYDQEQIALLPEAQEIPVFPDPDSIRRIGDTLVIRLAR